MIRRSTVTAKVATGVAVTLVVVFLAQPAPAQFTLVLAQLPQHPGRQLAVVPRADGRYSERIYDHLVNGVPKFEVHMGPRREFAIFEGVQDEHRDHASPENLLQPYRLDTEGGLVRHEWKIPTLNLVFTATLAGGSRGDCESWYVLLAPSGKPKPSH